MPDFSTMNDDEMNEQPEWGNLTKGYAADDSDPWGVAAAQQRAERETAQMAENQKLFDQFAAIEQGERQKQVALNQQKAIAGAAMMESAFRNGGMSDRSLSAAFSEAFGMPVYGGQFVDLDDGGKGFAIYGATKDQQGNATIAPVALMRGEEIMKILGRAKLGDRTAKLQKDIYADLSSRLTPEQLGARGIQNPSAPISTGATVISGAGMRALRGQPRQRSTVGVFSNIGGDGQVNSGTYSSITPPGGQEIVTSASGTRDPNWQGNWKVVPHVSVLPDGTRGTRYRNSKTGETVDVPEGQNLGDIIAARTRKPTSGLTFDERRQLQQESDERRAERDAAAQQTRLAIANLNAEQRKKAMEAANELKKLGIDVNIDLAEARAAESAANSMERATDGFTPRYSNEQVQEQRKKGEEARAKARDRIASAQRGGGKAAQGEDVDISKAISNAKTKYEFNEILKAAPEGTKLTIGNVTKVKRGGKWEKAQ